MSAAPDAVRRREFETRRDSGEYVYDNLWEPVQVAGVTIANRIVRTAHGTRIPWGEGLNRFHAARARGGVGLSIVETAGVHPSSLTLIPVHQDAIVADYERLAAAVHPHGMKLFQQLGHGGHSGPNPRGGGPWSASPVPGPVYSATPVEMSRDMIAEVVGAYAAAAGRVQDGGLDGVEIHSAHGMLPTQFLSSATNRREDEYGGSLENRTRFLLEVIEAIRTRVGPMFPIGVRLGASDEIAGGMVPEEAARIARLIEGSIDYLNVSIGSPYRYYKMLSTLDDPLGYELPQVSEVNRAVSIPRMVTGRIMTLDHASQLIADREADLVSIVRATIADPELVRKSRDGHAAQVRPCIGTSQGCFGSVILGASLTCVTNPAVPGVRDGLLSDVPEPAAVRAKVLVAGGGPAGLEAARAAALRGHEVVLFELTRHLGGQVAIAGKAPHRSDMLAITQWLGTELERLGVTVRLNHPVDPDVVASVAPDVVVVATGASPRRDGFTAGRPGIPITGFDLPHVHSTWDLFGFGGRATVGTSALVFDDTGSFEAISVAEELIGRGAAVTFVSRFEQIGNSVPGRQVSVMPARERLLGGPYEFLGGHILTEITPDHVEIQVLGGNRRRRAAADTVVLVTQNLPNRDLTLALADFPGTVLQVGDVNGTSDLGIAIREGHLAMRSYEP